MAPGAAGAPPPAPQAPRQPHAPPPSVFNAEAAAAAASWALPRPVGPPGALARSLSASRAAAQHPPPPAAERHASSRSAPNSPRGSIREPVGYPNPNPYAYQPAGGRFSGGEPQPGQAGPAAGGGAGMPWYGSPNPKFAGHAAPNDMFGFLEEGPPTPAALWADQQAPYSALTPSYVGTPYPMHSSQGTPFSGGSSDYGGTAGTGAARDGRPPPTQPRSLDAHPEEAAHAGVAAERPYVSRTWLNPAYGTAFGTPPGDGPAQYGVRSGEALAYSHPRQARAHGLLGGSFHMLASKCNKPAICSDADEMLS